MVVPVRTWPPRNISVPLAAWGTALRLGKAGSARLQPRAFPTPARGRPGPLCEASRPALTYLEQICPETGDERGWGKNVLASGIRQMKQR